MNDYTGLPQVKLAKADFSDRFGQATWCRGVGIARVGPGFALRVNIDPDQTTPEVVQAGRYNGVPLHVVKMSGYQARQD